MKWVTTIGIELHAQLKAAQKLFSHAPVSWNAAPNTLLAPFDTALPGTYPKLNSQCVHLAVLAALAFQCNISQLSSFDRKHYFYPDLPAGYQITQKYFPFAKNGKVILTPSDDQVKDQVQVRIEQIQLEQDTAKTTITPDKLVNVDRNRAGVGLIEIVSAPDISSPKIAGAYVRKVQDVLRHVGASDGNMEAGSLRIDANVSVQKEGINIPGTRCEIKNLNSVRFMIKALEYEVKRHVELLESGKQVAQESRQFDVVSGTTYKLRDKSDSPDYRYMPDPDLPPLKITKDFINKAQSEMKELPWQTRERLCRDYGIAARDSKIIVGLGADEGLIGIGTNYFERLVGGRPAPWPKQASNWFAHDLLGALSKQELRFSECPLDPEKLAQILEAVNSRTITVSTGKELMRKVISGEIQPNKVDEIIETSSQESILLDVDQVAQQVINYEIKTVNAIKNGNPKAIMKLVGLGMKLAQGKVDGRALREALERKLL